MVIGRSQKLLRNGFHGRFKEHQAIGAADSQLAGTLGMRHQTDDVTAVVADPGDVVQRTVRVRSGVARPAAST